MANYGNTGVSSLIKSAGAALKSQNNYNDEIQGYQYNLSDQGDAAYQAYSTYLNGRISALKDTDPTTALSLTKTLTSAQRSNTSSKIQQASLATLNGTGSDQSKLGVLQNLYQAAAQNGDMNTAQNLQQEYDTLSLKIQNDQYQAQQSAIAAGKAATDAQQKAANNAAYNLINDTTPTNPDGSLNWTIATLKASIAKNGLAGTNALLKKQDPNLSVAREAATLAQKAALLYAQGGDTSAASNIISGNTTFEIAPKFRVSLDDLTQEVNQNMNKQSDWTNSTDQGVHTLAKAFTSGQRFAKTADGKYVVMNTEDNVANKDLGALKDKLSKIKINGQSVKVLGLTSDGGISFIDPRYTDPNDPRAGKQVAYPGKNGELLFQNGTDAKGNAIVSKFDLTGKGTISDVSQQEIDARINEAGKPTGNNQAQPKPDVATPLPGQGNPALGSMSPNNLMHNLSSPHIGSLLNVGHNVSSLIANMQANAANAAKKRAVQYQQALATAAANSRAGTASIQNIAGLRSGIPYVLNGKVVNVGGAPAVPKAYPTLSNTLLAPSGNGVSGLFTQKYFGNPYAAFGLTDAQYAVINAGTNYGGTVAQLKQQFPGINLNGPSQGTASGADMALRAANASGQFK